MSRPITRLLAEEAALGTTPSTFAGQRLIRILNNTAGAVVVTVKEGATVTGSMTVPAGTISYIEKTSTETVEAAVDVLAVPVAYK